MNGASWYFLLSFVTLSLCLLEPVILLHSGDMPESHSQFLAQFCNTLSVFVGASDTASQW